MKKNALQIVSLVFAFLLIFCFGGCGVPGGGELPKIETPQVQVLSDGEAVWEAVEHAGYYKYTIDGGAETITPERSVQLQTGQTIRVKAISVEEEYLDSDFSAPQTYEKGNFVELSVYAVNDLHGKFMDTSTQPGLDEFTTYYKYLVKDPAREEILISSGDMWQGTAESLLSRGKLMTEWMNDIGFSSMTLGNHEFDWGSDVLTPNSELADFPFLAINVRENGRMPGYCKASTVVEKGGVKVGIIGAIGNCLSSISSEFRGGLRFETDDTLTGLVKTEATRLREEEGCGIIVYSIHDGGSGYSPSGINEVSSDLLSVRDGNSTYDYYDTALSDGYVDVVFEGHTHQKYTLKDKFGVYHLQSGSENESIACVDISYNTQTGESVISPRHISRGTYASSSIEDDPIVDALYGKYFPARDLYTSIGRNASTRYSSEILSTVARLYYQKGMEEWGETYTITCGGGFLNARDPYKINAGSVSYADIACVLPFDNAIVLGSISGSDLIRFLNRRTATNNKYTIYTMIEPDAVSAGETYYIIVDSYTSTYRSNNITEIARLDGNTYARDLLAEFIEGGNWA